MLLLVTSKFQLDCSIRIFDCSIRVYRYIVNAAWYLYRGLSPSHPTPHPVSATLNNTPYNIIVCALGDILSMIIIIITNQALMIKLYQ